MVYERRRVAARKKGLKEPEDIVGGGRMYAQANDPAMAGQRKHCSIAKVSIQSDQDARLQDGPLKEIRIIRATQSYFAGPHDIMAQGPKPHRQRVSEHLVQEQAHVRSGVRGFGELGMEHALLGKAQSSLHIRARQLGKPSENRVPGFSR